MKDQDLAPAFFQTSKITSQDCKVRALYLSTENHLGTLILYQTV